MSPPPATALEAAGTSAQTSQRGSASGCEAVAATFTYSPSTLRLTRLETHGLKLDYNYTAPGTMVQTGHIYDISDVYSPSKSQHYAYDRWYRLSEWWKSNARTDPYDEKMTWSYDRYNNMTGLNYYQPINCPDYMPCPTTFAVSTATNRATSRTDRIGQVTYFGYDLAGNMTHKGTFDAENRLTSSGSSSFLYDGHSRRLRKLYGSTKVYYVYSIRGTLLVEDHWTAAKVKNHIYFNGQLIATHDQGDYVRFLFKDHLGSTRNVVKVTPGSGWATNWVTTETYDRALHGKAARRIRLRLLRRPLLRLDRLPLDVPGFGQRPPLRPPVPQQIHLRPKRSSQSCR